MSPRLSSPNRNPSVMRTKAAIVLAVSALVALLSYLGWSMVGAGRAMHGTAQRAVQVAEIRGRVSLLDEDLTMSARMASATGDAFWIQRFEETAPSLDAAIAAAVAMATPEARVSLAETMIEPHRDLMQMERRALSLVASGQLDDARSLIRGPELAYLQDVYATGMEVFGEDLRGDANQQASALNTRIVLQTVGFGLGAILLVAFIMTAQHRVRLGAAANIDALTGLFNRRHFYELLASRPAPAGAVGGWRSVLLLIGIDHFKVINDERGHAAADRALQLVAARLRALAPDDCVLARVGGDEFAMLIGCESSAAPDDGLARRVLSVLDDPYRFETGATFPLRFSAGAAWVEAGSDDMTDTMRQAGTALRQAKADGRNCVRVFDKMMDERARARVRLEADLRRAIDRDEIVPHFQPLIDLRSGLVIGVEALARWNNGERGAVSPATFIPMAEELGLIGSLTERLLRRACRDALPWPSHLTVAFNVSPLQLRDPSLVDSIRAILAETDFPTQRLEIEVTESALVQDLDLARSMLEDLRASGVRLALDDFGTGYSSLKHLNSLPFDKLKIDASFVGGMVDDRECGKIVDAVVGLGHSLGMSTVAEGVETAQTAALLRDLGCDIGQGWFFGRPVPADKIALLVGGKAKPGLAA